MTTDYLARHRALFDEALTACADRRHFSGWPENPSSKLHGEELPAAGRARFEALLGKPFPLEQPAETGRIGEEVSPYTREPLGISYPKVDVPALFDAIDAARGPWAAAEPETRVGLCLEMLARCGEQLFENAHATMHTSGQSYVMAFAGSGANALDRGLEALAYAHKAMADVPRTGRWQRQFGRDGVAGLLEIGDTGCDESETPQLIGQQVIERCIVLDDENAFVLKTLGSLIFHSLLHLLECKADILFSAGRGVGSSGPAQHWPRNRTES